MTHDLNRILKLTRLGNFNRVNASVSIYRSIIGAWSTTGTYVLGERLMHAKLIFLNSHAIVHKVFFSLQRRKRVYKA